MGGFWPLMIALVFMVGITSFTEGQNVQPCVQKLAPCADFMNTTNPPATCCNPLKETETTNLTYLCNLFSSPGLLESFGVNYTEALQLTRRCGLATDLSNCTASAPPPLSATVTPPATPGGDNGDASRVACAGLPILLMYWASMLLN